MNEWIGRYHFHPVSCCCCFQPAKIWCSYWWWWWKWNWTTTTKKGHELESFTCMCVFGDLFDMITMVTTMTMTNDDIDIIFLIFLDFSFKKMNVAWAHQSNFVSNFLSFLRIFTIHGLWILRIIHFWIEEKKTRKKDPYSIHTVYPNTSSSYAFPFRLR